jgi:hypothetical protein
MGFIKNKFGCCLGFPGSGLWLFFTEDDAIPVAKWEFVWRFLVGPINFAL